MKQIMAAWIGIVTRMTQIAPHSGVMLMVAGIGLVVFQMTRRPRARAMSHIGGGYAQRFNPAVSTTYLGLALIVLGVVLLMVSAIVAV
jgi:hypothetical protein